MNTVENQTSTTEQYFTLQRDDDDRRNTLPIARPLIRSAKKWSRSTLTYLPDTITIKMVKTEDSKVAHCL